MPNTHYADDDAVNSLLDKLIANGQPGTNITNKDPTTCQQDVTFTASTVYEGLDAANSLLSASKFYQELPELSEDRANATTVLATALSVLVNLSRANTANIKLRQEAEAHTRDANGKIEQLEKLLTSSRHKLEIQTASAVAAQQRAQSTMRAFDESERQHNMQHSDLVNQLQRASAKERQLVMEAKRQENDLAKLKQRVHCLIKSSRPNSTLIAHVTISSDSTHSTCAETKSECNDLLESDSHITETASRTRSARLDTLQAENNSFRDMLRAIQEELDELIILCDCSSDEKEACHLTRPDKYSDDTIDGENDGSSNYKNTGKESCGNEGKRNMKPELEEGTPWKQVLGTDDIIAAPTKEQMRLPFEVIEEEFKGSLEQKFRIVREALTLLKNPDGVNVIS